MGAFTGNREEAVARLVKLGVRPDEAENAVAVAAWNSASYPTGMGVIFKVEKLGDDRFKVS